MARINPRKTTALDNHPALKGRQSRLPDELQAKIIGSKLKKTAEPRNRYFGLGGSEKLSSLTKLSSDLEGRMAKRQLTEICEMAQELLMYVGDEDDLHEWVQNKITTIHDRLSSVHSYVSYEKKNPPMMAPQMLGTGV